LSRVLNRRVAIVILFGSKSMDYFRVAIVILIGSNSMDYFRRLASSLVLAIRHGPLCHLNLSDHIHRFSPSTTSRLCTSEISRSPDQTSRHILARPSRVLPPSIGRVIRIPRKPRNRHQLAQCNSLLGGDRRHQSDSPPIFCTLRSIRRHSHVQHASTCHALDNSLSEHNRYPSPRRTPRHWTHSAP
jgi:hypothetical protein